MKQSVALLFGLIFGLSAHAGAQSDPASSRAKPAGAQGANQAITLEQARASFATSDADKNSQLSLTEATALGFDAASIATCDWNSDQTLSADEFVTGYHQVLVRQGKTAATDLEAESTRLQALRRAQRSEELKQRRQEAAGGSQGTATGGAGSPLPLGPSQRVRSAGSTGRGATDGEPFVADDSQRTDQSGGGPSILRRAAAMAAQDSGETREEKLKAIQETLNKRLRAGEITDEQARAAYERVSRRIENALGSPPQSAGNPNPALGPRVGIDAAPTREEQLQAIQDSLNKRLRNADLSQRESLQAYERVQRRIENALKQPTSSDAGGADSGAPRARPSPPAGEPADTTPSADSAPSRRDPKPSSLDQKILEAQRDLTRRVRNGQVEPDQAGKAQEQLRRRIDRALGNKPGAATPNAGPAGQPVDRARRSKSGQNEITQPPPAPSGRRSAETPPPAPAGDPKPPELDRGSRPREKTEGGTR